MYLKVGNGRVNLLVAKGSDVRKLLELARNVDGRAQLSSRHRLIALLRREQQNEARHMKIVSDLNR